MFLLCTINQIRDKKWVHLPGKMDVVILDIFPINLITLSWTMISVHHLRSWTWVIMTQEFPTICWGSYITQSVTSVPWLPMTVVKPLTCVTAKWADEADKPASTWCSSASQLSIPPYQPGAAATAAISCHCLYLRQAGFISLSLMQKTSNEFTWPACICCYFNRSFPNLWMKMSTTATWRMQCLCRKFVLGEPDLRGVKLPQL